MPHLFPNTERTEQTPVLDFYYIRHFNLEYRIFARKRKFDLRHSLSTRLAQGAWR